LEDAAVLMCFLFRDDNGESTCLSLLEELAYPLLTFTPIDFTVLLFVIAARLGESSIAISKLL
jgi:hypothetical protein